MADARTRAAAGELRKVEGPTTCTLTPGTKAGGPVGASTASRSRRTSRRAGATSPGMIGYPFRAVVNFGTFSYAWCKVEQLPGERLIPDPRTIVQLPKACQIPKSVT